MKLIIDIPEEHYRTLQEAMKNHMESLIGKIILKGTPIPDNIGDFSDGYHTFNQLYHQRAVLFATIVNLNKNISWKSWKHDDGKYCFDSNGEWFIVGIDTPQGSYTYHYEKAYWDMFKCHELSNGKHWDGHTEDDVIRLLSLVPLVSIPDNATNGEVFGKIMDYMFMDDAYITTDRHGYLHLRGVKEDWWNAPYQKGGKE